MTATLSNHASPRSPRSEPTLGEEAWLGRKIEEGEEALHASMAQQRPFLDSLLATLKFYCSPFDTRYEDLGKFGSAQFCKGIIRDCMAGLVLAMVGIPTAMGFAIAAGLLPAQGIVAGVIAGLLGALLGGSKYQVYGPTASFIPVISGIMALHAPGGIFYSSGVSGDEAFRRGHGLLVLTSLIAGILLIALGLSRLGALVAKVPSCILVGFTLGMAFTLAISNVEEALGYVQTDMHKVDTHALGGGVPWPTREYVWSHHAPVNWYALTLALVTLICMQLLNRLSAFISSVLALVALVLPAIVAQTVWKDKGLRNVFDHHGHIQQVFAFSPPVLHTGDAHLSQVVGTVLYYAISIVLVGAVESLLCGRMADSLAGNTGTPFHPSKELWGQGWMNAVVPLFNGFPHGGAPDRVALNVKLGAVTPFAGIVKSIVTLGMVLSFSKWLEMVPMASIAGLLWYAAVNMVSGVQIVQVYKEGGWAHILVTCMTTILVMFTDLLHGIASGMVVYSIVTIVSLCVPDSPANDEEKGTDEEKGSNEEKTPMLDNRKDSASDDSAKDSARDPHEGFEFKC